ncbi:RimJ/RimL family protein N-acetyltransferase [Streptomyces phaeochromogenes]|jgi:RimJ/RimL family protein N-acetyltransferase|uniref:GNAT family N-acetyltransferase n=1 Tax=Streptomyces TaxID=1883 RepID=UPI00278DAF7E|nr:GNAT family protein [Streptomyces phaeochromogenes]MDQ0955025.1 RimJ/RimL family protein N-acetyltransferase [Streptomyces phaeochromogenes]
MLLETPRLVLRRFRAEDAAPLAAYRSDPLVARYQGWTAPVPLDSAVRMVRGLATGSPEEPGWFQYAIELKADRCLVGDVGVCLHENRMQAELGFTLAGDRQGHGYATEAVRAVLGDLFERRGLHRVSAECDARNDRSARLLRRVGFLQEGLLRQASWIKDEWTDDLLFGLLASDWQSSEEL